MQTSFYIDIKSLLILNMQDKWKPSASIDTLRTRASLLSCIRRFFESRGVMEVETPILSHSTVTDVHLEAMSTLHTNPMTGKQSKLWMQTSPEFAMKRLLCAGSGCIYQLCKSIRDDEVGKRHNPEFTMLEWYRVGFDMQLLIDEVDMFLQATIGSKSLQQMTYQQAFINYLDFDPFAIDINTLVELCKQNGFANISTDVLATNNSGHDIDILLQFLFSHSIEPYLGSKQPTAITHFPKTQAALAKLSPDNPNTALRFEVYIKGVELANGYEELQDPEVQRQRMDEDNQTRLAIGKQTKAIDTLFLDGLVAGLPACSGVALGVDRLLMLKLGLEDIKHVISFSIENA